MSIFSKFLKRAAGIPETNLIDNPIAQIFIGELATKGTAIALKPLSDLDLQFVNGMIEQEIKNREKKKIPTGNAGIGKA